AVPPARRRPVRRRPPRRRGRTRCLARCGADVRRHLLTFTGAVLCGGRSSRMGTDKAQIRIDGVPMAIRVGGCLLEAGADRILAIGAATTPLGQVGVPDRWPGEGPVGGVITALGVAGTDVAVLACDLLAPSVAAVRAV